MKAKFKLMELAAQPVDLELVHPVFGDTGIIVKLVGPHSTEYHEIVKQMIVEQQAGTEQMESSGKRMMAACIVGWDEEGFEMPYSKEAALEVVSKAENTWMLDQIALTIEDYKKFFRQKG